MGSHQSHRLSCGAKTYVIGVTGLVVIVVGDMISVVGVVGVVVIGVV